MASRRSVDTDSILKTGETFTSQSKLGFANKGVTDGESFKERYIFWKSYLDKQ